jgi:hypothetical protein
VLEEGDAARMIAELIRVTRPGGRIGVIVRAIDVAEWVNAPLGAATKAKVEAPSLFGAGVVASGCADASLYARFRAVGLTDLHLFPQLTAVTPDDPRFPMFRQQALGAIASAPMLSGRWQRWPASERVLPRPIRFRRPASTTARPLVGRQTP